MIGSSWCGCSWQELETAEPLLAEFGRERLDGRVAYLATVRRDGSPRTHPVLPVVGGGRCFVFIEPGSPKVRDLCADGRYSVHCSVNDASGASGEFQMSGRARLVTDSVVWEEAAALSIFQPGSRYQLFELCVTDAVSTAWRSGQAVRRRWSAGDGAGSVAEGI